MINVSDYITLDETRVGSPPISEFSVVLGILPFIITARAICERYASTIFRRSVVGEKMFYRKPKELPLSEKKFQESFWKFVYYGLSALYGLGLISWEAFIWYPFKLLPPIVYPKVYWYYMIQTSFYVWMSVCLLWDVRKKG